MTKLNDKGQSLVLFILVIPILLGIMALVVDVGKAMTLKNRLDNVIELALECELDNDINEDTKAKLETLINYNLEDTKTTVNIENDKIEITVTTSVDGIFSSILSINYFNITSSYIGYIENGQKVIQKN